MNSAPFPQFEIAPERPRLRLNDVHIWRAFLDKPSPAALETLSATEIIRANRFHFERDRERFIAARELLRAVLSAYLDAQPRELQFVTGPHGKPAIADQPLRFNLSHCEEVMLVAVTCSREVGVDVERMREAVPFEMLAEHYFAPEDAWHMRVLPGQERMRKFYTLWTSAEAQLKALGTGLAGARTSGRDNRLMLRTFSPADGYAAALAVEGGNSELACFSCRS
jgi:4'-phosphopantetheinyl transferase